MITWYMCTWLMNEIVRELDYEASGLRDDQLIFTITSIACLIYWKETTLSKKKEVD